MTDEWGWPMGEQIAANKRALAPVIADLERTCELSFEIRVEEDDEAAQVWVTSEFGGSGYVTWGLAQDPETAKAEMADYIQEQLMDQGVTRFWPTCGHHASGLHAEVREARAVWFCRVGEHVVGAIGELEHG